MSTQPIHDIEVSHDRKIVWVTAGDGSCVGRFSKRFGIDVHKPVEEQLASGSQCLHCMHESAEAAARKVFRAEVLVHHRIDVPVDLFSWP